MKDRFKTISAAMVLLVEGDKVLLQLRKNTGFSDGMWDFSATGHVEAGETMRQAAIREAKEEIGVEIKEMRFGGLIHDLGDDKIPRYLGLFIVTKHNNTPEVKEPEKCEELRWFSLKDLPDNIIGSRKLALENLNNSPFYAEYGWLG